MRPSDEVDAKYDDHHLYNAKNPVAVRLVESKQEAHHYEAQANTQKQPVVKRNGT
jgi:hypothetical protein